MPTVFDHFLIDGVVNKNNPATFKINKNISVTAYYVTGMSLVIKNGTSTDKKISVTTSTEYVVPANSQTTIVVKTGDTITLE